MRIDSAIQLFSEKYDREAFESIDSISRERGLILNKCSIPAFEMAESFDKFSQYIREYANYKVENKENEKASPQQVIRESVSAFIGTQLFQESKLYYDQLPQFVMSYTEGVKKVSEAIEEAKATMLEGGVESEAIADVNDFADLFMDKLHESFDPTMDKILRASGYTSKRNLRNRRNSKVQHHTFL